MSKSNILYAVIAILAVAAAALGYQVYQDRQQTRGIEIEIGPGSLSIEER